MFRSNACLNPFAFVALKGFQRTNGVPEKVCSSSGSRNLVPDPAVLPGAMSCLTWVSTCWTSPILGYLCFSSGVFPKARQ